MTPDISKSPIGIVMDLPAQKKKGSGAAKKGDALRDAGNELFRAGDYGAAAVKYGEAIAANPADAAALANRAECYLRVRQFHLALQDATASLDADGEHTKAIYKVRPRPIRTAPRAPIDSNRFHPLPPPLNPLSR